MKNKKICIIGAGGLIGQSLIDKISQQDDVEITAFDRVSPSQKATARWIQGDLEHSENFLDLVKEQDVIIHLAHSNVPLTADQDMARDTYLNLLPTIRILQAIEEAKHYPLFLYPSSGGAIYGNSLPGHFWKEDDSCMPNNSYGIQKLVAEHYIRLFAQRGALRASVLRIANVYGWLLPPDRPQGIIGTAITRVLTGKPVRIVGNPDNVRDYVHVSDVVDAFMMFMNNSSNTIYNTYNIGTGIGYSVNDVISIIESTVGFSVEREMAELDSAQFLPGWSVLDVKKSEKELGWKNKVDLKEGIFRLVELGRKELSA